MTNHPSVGELQAYLDGEGAFERRESIDRHVVQCDGCGHELDGLRSAARLTTGALAVLDPPPVDVSVARWGVRRARSTARMEGLRRAAAMVATVVVVGAAGWVAAAPGSPLRSLFRSGPAPESTAVVATPSGQEAAGPMASVGIPVGMDPIEIVFMGVPAGTELTVSEADAGSPATATAPESASFNTAEGRIAVDVGSATGALSVALPSGANARVVVNGQALLERAAGQDTFPGPAPAPAEGGLTFPVGGP